MFARRNFCKLRAELKFRIFIFTNDCLIIYISYILLMFTLLSVQEDGGIVLLCELRAWIPCVSRDLDCNGGRNADLQQGNTQQRGSLCCGCSEEWWSCQTRSSVVVVYVFFGPVAALGKGSTRVIYHRVGLKFHVSTSFLTQWQCG